MSAFVRDAHLTLQNIGMPPIEDPRVTPTLKSHLYDTVLQLLRG